MKTLKRIGALVAAVAVLLAMAGCKKTRKAHDGADSAEELLTKVIDFLNGDIQYKEVENWFDWYGCIAYEIINDTGIKCDFFTVRDVIDDLQEDPEYIREHHKEFAEAFEKATGHGIEKPEDLKGNNRSREIAIPRQISMYLLRQLTNLSLNDIGKELGRNHTTALSSIRKIEEMMRTDSEMTGVIRDITSNITTSSGSN